MEEWHDIVDTYEEADGRGFLKACECAQHVLADDLAPVEIDWFVDTLLLEPFNLLKTVASRRTSVDGYQEIAQAFKLLSHLVAKYPDAAAQHFESIVNLCELTYDAKSRPAAVACLTSVARHSQLAAADFMKYVRHLDSKDSGCKAPIAELVGAICEHHADVVAEEISTIWRVYLNLLDLGDFSGTVKRSLLVGAEGMLKSFGPDLPTAELNEFYDRMVQSKSIDKCKEALLTLLQRHSGLFRERLAADGALREELWALLRSGRFAPAPGALAAVYAAVARTLAEDRFRAVLESEVEPRADESDALVRFTALRVMHAHARTHYDAHAHARIEAPALTHALGRARFSPDHAQAILWCVEARTPEGELLLRASLQHHEALKREYRDLIAVQGLLNSPPDMRKRLVAFLACETCRSLKEGHGERYLTLWASLFGGAGGEGAVKSEQLFEDFLEHLVETLECHSQAVEADGQEPPETLQWTVRASARIVPLAGALHGGRERGAAALRLLAGLAAGGGRGAGGALAAMRPLLARLEGRHHHHHHLTDFVIEDCGDDEEVRERCLALLLAPVGSLQEAARALMAVEITLSDTGLESGELSSVLCTLEELVSDWGEGLGEEELGRVVTQVRMLHQRAVYKGREGRELRRSVLMFLGKHGRRIQANISGDETFHLRSCLTLKIPNLDDDATSKLNLQGLFRLALESEDPKALRPLLDLMRANSSGRPMGEQEERALCEGACALAAAHAPLQLHLLDACAGTAAGHLLQVPGPLMDRPTLGPSSLWDQTHSGTWLTLGPDPLRDHYQIHSEQTHAGTIPHSGTRYTQSRLTLGQDPQLGPDKLWEWTPRLEPDPHWKHIRYLD
ncbi:unnamed protein product, partial [Iphiclides podalirius]